MILGITGGTGCGKTTLLNILRDHGCLVLDCDAIYHSMLQTDRVLLDAIEANFPAAFENGQLIRKKLGGIVFADPSALELLNSITHKAIRQEVIRRLAENTDLAAIDAIALFEGGLAELCDLTVAVTASTEARVQRLIARDCISEEYARSRIHAQKDAEWFAARCDCVLENDSSQENFYRKCIDFLQMHSII